MATIKQLLREFWIPFLIASAWTGYSLYTATESPSITSGVALFGSAFFLASWASGQFVRVNRQARTDQGLKGVEARVLALTSQLEDAAKSLTSTITGGDSAAYLAMSSFGFGKFKPIAVHVGDFPLSNVAARVVDLQKLKLLKESGGHFSEADTYVSIGELPANTAVPSQQTFTPAGREFDCNIFFSARNGHWTQLLRGRTVGIEMIFAIIIPDDEGLPPKFVHVPHDFPMIGDALFDEAERLPKRAD